jgi:phosphoglycerol transferase MdoB-like AlkP superfamily enzyme
VVSTYLQQLLVLIKRLFVCYLAYFICRILFYLSNISYFDAGFFDLLKDCFFGLRTDSFSIVASNGLFILLSLFPSNWFWKKAYQKILLWLFTISNSVFIAANCIDIGYFPFIRKRSSADLLEQIGGQSDMARLIPQFLKDFWGLFLCYLVIIGLMIFLYRRIHLREVKNRYILSQPKQWTLIIFIFIFSGGLAVLAVRGGLQRVPITIVDAGAMTNSEEVPIVLNTPFTIIKSLDERPLDEYDFYTPLQLKSIYDPVRYYKDSVFKKQNVVVLILESFAKEYTKLGHHSITPFLDSLMDHSLTFTNAYSNGSKSIEGIPAILSSLPSFMEGPFINSPYSFNAQTSLAYLLNKEDYQTAFFHGGINGTMNFDSWASLAGYGTYFGRKEYNNDEDFDNFWGIWDEPFLQYSVEKMSSFRQPFHTAIFTLSSHHPYRIPEKYKNKFPKGDLENSESIGYADYALKQFFISAKKTSWYANTIFVLTADHGSLSEDPFYSNVVGNQSIPILFFKPDNSLRGIHKRVFSQIDILPSVLALLGYNKPFFSFGESFNEKKYGNDYFYANGTHYLFSDSMLFCFKTPKLIQTYDYLSDSTLHHYLIDKYPQLDSAAGTGFRAFIQAYSQTLIHNKGRVK